MEIEGQLVEIKERHMISAKRENWIDSLKGIAIVCVVLGHILDGAMKKEMFPSTVWMGGLDRIIYSFHMPLFFVMSGVSFYLGVVKKKLNFLGADCPKTSALITYTESG